MQGMNVARGSVVVKALSYEPEHYGFETRWGEYIFSIYLILLAATVTLGVTQPPTEMSTRVEYKKSASRSRN
jgi:hypothetical protein